jgi:hypothetical protein
VEPAGLPGRSRHPDGDSDRGSLITCGRCICAQAADPGADPRHRRYQNRIVGADTDLAIARLFGQGDHTAPAKTETAAAAAPAPASGPPPTSGAPARRGARRLPTRADAQRAGDWANMEKRSSGSANSWSV